IPRRIPTHPQRLGRTLNHPDTPGKRHTIRALTLKFVPGLRASVVSGKPNVTDQIEKAAARQIVLSSSSLELKTLEV
ncbi:MAG: hypothetical protein E7L25_03100, partial [Varibaculum cambriense]|nr:hypothetical protein [Varibaculum cambriense]